MRTRLQLCAAQRHSSWWALLVCAVGSCACIWGDCACAHASLWFWRAQISRIFFHLRTYTHTAALAHVRDCCIRALACGVVSVSMARGVVRAVAISTANAQLICFWLPSRLHCLVTRLCCSICQATAARKKRAAKATTSRTQSMMIDGASRRTTRAKGTATVIITRSHHMSFSAASHRQRERPRNIST